MHIEKTRVLAMVDAARDQREKAYAPYSKFRVGAAVLGGSGKVYLGSNVENASYGLSVCAERVAIFRAISDGETEIRAVVVCAEDSELSPPCGACLQVISEFSTREDPAVIVTCCADGLYAQGTLADHLPLPFSLT